MPEDKNSDRIPRFVESVDVATTGSAPEDISSEKPKGAAPLFIHDKEFRDAVRAVTLTAAGRNPFSSEPFEKLRPEHRDSVLQALCIVSSSLAAQFAHNDKQSSSSLEDPDISGIPTRRPLPEFLEKVERQVILEALEEAKYNQTAAARLLGLSFRALRYRLEKLGIDAGSE